MEQDKSEVDNIDTNVQRLFDLATRLVESLPSKGPFQPSYSEMSKVYGYFKQAHFGPCSIPRPGFWDVVNRAKWDSWSSLKQMSRETAMKHYVEEVQEIYCRVHQLEEFSGREREFADILIPFCEATGLPLSPTLKQIKRTKEPDNKTTISSAEVTNTELGSICCGVQRIQHEEEVIDLTKLPDDQESSSVMKHGSFTEDANDPVNSESDDDVFCDSLGPDQFVSDLQTTVEPLEKMSNNRRDILKESESINPVGGYIPLHKDQRAEESTYWLGFAFGRIILTAKHPFKTMGTLIAHPPTCVNHLQNIYKTPLCENEDLRKDAEFVDELGTLLLRHKPSIRINAQVLSIKKQYAVARRNVKKRIQVEKSTETVETDSESENEQNIFENMFN